MAKLADDARQKKQGRQSVGPRRRVEEGDGLARTGDEVVGIYAQLGTSTRIVCFLRALVSHWIGSTRIVCFLRALVSHWIGSTWIVYLLRALVSRRIRSTRIVCFFRALPTGSKKVKIRHTYQCSFSPGSSYQPGLKR